MASRKADLTHLDSEGRARMVMAGAESLMALDEAAF